MIPKNIIDTVDRMLAVTREVGPNSYIFHDTKRQFDRFYDREIYEKFTVAELAIFTSILLTALHDSFERADRDGKKLITL